jgi:Ribbon-helix-helix protein, copG family
MMRRTTVAADREALDTLEAEARRRGISLGAIVAEAIENKAQSIRSARRPRVGVGRSTDGQSAAELTAEPVAKRPA